MSTTISTVLTPCQLSVFSGVSRKNSGWLRGSTVGKSEPDVVGREKHEYCGAEVEAEASDLPYAGAPMTECEEEERPKEGDAHNRPEDHGATEA